MHTPPLPVEDYQPVFQEAAAVVPNYLPSPLNNSPPQRPEQHQSYGANFAEYLNDLVNLDPREALDNSDLAEIFCHYINFLAPWYDLCESECPFGTVVPMRALETPVLFKALIAFSALHKCKIDDDGPGLGLAFHAACVQDLLKIVEGGNIDLERRGDYLAATCLLRSYEILTG